jgi:catechol 2,3-dioxygenase-like lactoylglutathione lyase family enzyme
MSVQLNHTIVRCRDKQRSAAFLTEILGLPGPERYGPFLVVERGVYFEDPDGHLLEVITRPYGSAG